LNTGRSIKDIQKNKEGIDYNMPLPEFTRKLVETKLTEYCEHRISIDIRDQVNLTFKILRDKVTLIETRPYFKDPSIGTENPVAQFRFDNETRK